MFDTKELQQSRLPHHKNIKTYSTQQFVSPVNGIIRGKSKFKIAKKIVILKILMLW